MRMNKLALATFVSVASLSFPLSALALDARDFADKLSIALSAGAGMNIEFKNASVDGDTITLSDWSSPDIAYSKGVEMVNTPIVFFDVKETKNGGYSAKRAEFEDIDFTDDDLNFKVNDITIHNILVPVDAEKDLLSYMTLYNEISTGEISVSYKGEEAFKIASTRATNGSNDDRSIFSSIFEVNDIFSDLSKIEDEEARAGLTAFGLTEIEGNIYGDATWTLADGRMKIDELYFDFKNIGRLNMVMDFSGYTLEVFESITKINKELAGIDPASPEYEAKNMEMLMSMAARMSLNEFSISFEDYGISTKILDLVAAQQGTTRDKMVPGLVMMAPMFLAEFEVPELQEQVSTAVSAYLNDPKNIEIKVKPENSTPIMAFVALVNNPPALLALLNISVLANQ